MEQQKNVLTVPTSIIISAVIITGALIWKGGPPQRTSELASAQETIAQKDTISTTLSIVWGDMGQKVASVGAIDRDAFLALYEGWEEEEARRLVDTSPESIVVNKENAGIVLNILWALGLSNKSTILEKGEMADPRYGGPDRFASTGGWTVSTGNPMDHYSRHLFMKMTPEQEARVGRVASGIYRPCCDNSTHFPDCNHGMAMLGFLEMLASQGSSEQEMYTAGLALNRLWFPEQYDMVDRYVSQKGIRNADAKLLLSASMISASGFQKVAQAVKTPPAERGAGGGGCSV